MINEKSTGCLIKASSGTLLYLYVDNQRLYYTRKNDTGWTAPKPVDIQLIKYYSAVISSDDKIMILAYLYAKELWLYEFTDGNWNKHNIYKISSRFENIPFLKLVLNQGKIHMLFYVESILRSTKELLMHYMLETDTWNRVEPLKFVSSAAISPLDISTGNHGSLYLYYKREFRSKTAFYLRIFNESSRTWSDKILLFERPGKCRAFISLADRSDNIHLIWNEESLRKQVLYYKKISKNNLGGGITEEVPIYYTTLDIKYPALVSANMPACFWMVEAKALYCLLKRNSSGTFEIQRFSREKICPYTAIINDGTNNVSATLYGDGYPDFTWNIMNLPDMEHNTDNTDFTGIENNTNASAYAISMAAQEQYEEKSLAELESRMDDLYKALIQIEEYMKQKDMSLYQLSTQVKKLAFDVEQLRSKNTLYRSRVFSRPKTKPSVNRGRPQDQIGDQTIRTVAYGNIKEAKDREKTNEEAKDKHEEILLGNVSIIVNPKEETEDDKE